MKIRWLLQACIVLAIGVGLVSCSKAEIEQAMNRPAEIMLQSSPCQPAGIASTATPEFCVNVMELQLLSRDTQADVSLTLVNRTGRRVFLSLSSSPYLTDSNGSRWERHSVTGIGFRSPRNVPVPLEPNVETQISILFTNKGQAPSEGTTFSMRGEIAIMKVDMRGQASPLDVVVNRGFNLSGIRIQQQPPQSSGSTNQDTKLAQVSPQGVAATTPKTLSPSDIVPSSTANQSSPNSAGAVVSEPIEIDIVGLRLGMSLAEVEKVFKQRHLDNGIVPSQSPALGKMLKVLTFRDIATGQAINIKDSEYVSSMRGLYDAGPIPGAQREEITVEFTPLHNREQVVSIWRQQYYSPGNQPAMDTFHKSLQDKYGSLRAKAGCDINGINCRYEWHYSQDGKPILNQSNECIGYNEYAGGRANIPDVEKYFKKCGSIEVVAKVDGRDNLVSGVRINAYNRELDASAHKTANAIMAAAEKERTDSRIQKARTQKPAL